MAAHAPCEGVVTSKREAAEWALDTLNPEWASLIKQALDDRPDPWLRVHQTADAGMAARTLEFAAYVTNESDTKGAKPGYAPPPR